MYVCMYSICTYVCLLSAWTDVCLPSIVYVYLFSHTQTHLLYCTQNMCVRVCVSRNPHAHNLPLAGLCMPEYVCVCGKVELGINIKREMRATSN